MFLIIDGSSMLVTSYFAFLPRELKFEKDEEKRKMHYDKLMHNSKGVYTNAIYGMMGQILKIVSEQKPEYMAVVFDKSRNTFRRELYADYKGQRKATEEPLKQQFILMEQLIEKMGIKCLYSESVEADDLAGSIAKKFEGPEMPVKLMTKDHDYLQLVNDYTKCWMVQTSKENAESLAFKYGVNLEDLRLPDKVFEFDSEVVYGEEGVRPIQIIDKKGLCGDKSDNIPGINGVGEKCVIPLLSKYDTIEGIYKEIEKYTDEASEKKYSTEIRKELGMKTFPIAKFKAGKMDAMLSKTLATIKTDCDVPAKLDDYKYEISNDVLKEILEEYEFNSLMGYIK